MLSVFSISFEQMAAMNVWDVEEKESKRLLGIFRRYSLIEFNSVASRYGLHELLREFCCFENTKTLSLNCRNIGMLYFILRYVFK